MPAALLALFAVYVPSFIYNFTHTAPYEIVADEIDIIVRESPEPEELVRDINRRYADPGASSNLGPEIVEIDETIVYEEKSPSVLKTLLTGLPSPTSLFWSLLTFLINLALVSL